MSHSENASPLFAPRASVKEVEEGTRLAPKFDADGLIPAVYEDVPATLHPFAARSLHAHLLQLADEGAVERLDGDLYRLQS